MNVLTAYTQGFSARDASVRSASDGADVPTNSANQSADNTDSITDVVDISPEAQALQEQGSTQKPADPRAVYYQQFRPVHEGFSSYNLSLGIVDPGAQPFSQDRSFDEVAQAARASLDTNYQKLEDIGRAVDYIYTTSEDFYSLYGELDRRALYAVASNQGSQFSKDEQEWARNIMIGQQGMAMGLYNGPSNMLSKFGNPALIDHEQVNKAGILFLDKVGTEEKATDIQWAVQRAVVQKNYEVQAAQKGKIPQNFNIDHPLVNLIRGALDAWYNSNDPRLSSDGDTSSKEELENEPWFTAYADRLDGAIAATKQQYGLTAG